MIYVFVGMSFCSITDNSCNIDKMLTPNSCMLTEGATEGSLDLREGSSAGAREFRFSAHTGWAGNWMTRFLGLGSSLY